MEDLLCTRLRRDPMRCRRTDGRLPPHARSIMSKVGATVSSTSTKRGMSLFARTRSAPTARSTSTNSREISKRRASRSPCCSGSPTSCVRASKRSMRDSRPPCRNSSTTAATPRSIRSRSTSNATWWRRSLPSAKRRASGSSAGPNPSCRPCSPCRRAPTISSSATDTRTRSSCASPLWGSGSGTRCSS